MAAQPNVTGMARLLYLVAGLVVVGWAFWGGAESWMKLSGLIVGGALCVLAIIGYSPLHAIFGAKGEKAS